MLDLKFDVTMSSTAKKKESEREKKVTLCRCVVREKRKKAEKYRKFNLLSSDTENKTIDNHIDVLGNFTRHLDPFFTYCNFITKSTSIKYVRNIL